MKDKKIKIRKDVNTTLNIELYNNIKILAVKLNDGRKANDLIEEGMKYVLDKYKEYK